jgi:RecB family exonuclease
VTFAVPTRLSPSALDRYGVCPRQFQYVASGGDTSAGGSGAHLAQANAVHHALERFFGLPPEQRSAETIERCLRAVWCDHRKRGTFASMEEEALLGTAAIAMLRRFTISFDVTATSLAREQWVSARLRDGFEVYGKVDRIDRSASGGLEVIDYKTGRRVLQEDELRRDLAAAVYAIGAQARFNEAVDRIRFLYLDPGREVVWEPEAEDIEAAGQRLLALVAEIRRDEEFVPRPGPACGFCPYLDCSARGRIELASVVPVEGLPF